MRATTIMVKLGNGSKPESVKNKANLTTMEEEEKKFKSETTSILADTISDTMQMTTN